MWHILYKISIVVAGVGHGADLATTQHCLGSGSCRETNPALMRFSDPLLFGTVKAGVGTGGILLVDRYAKADNGKHLKKATLLNFGQGIGFMFIARHNSRIDVRGRQ
jgi:hypothetical protein